MTVTPRNMSKQKWKRPEQPRQANVLKRKKAGFPFILLRLFDPEGLGAGTGRKQKWKRPEQPRQANVLKRKKGGLPFILLGLYDFEELSPFQWGITLRRWNRMWVA
ncbi:hypothetical protein ACQCVP_17125 [Rossellomorea vietnamensis]|uniref:hypothetical protein n=1 Tax=Rossellomorea vietnamensis TaxID=218284 RepID=UPI003CEFC6E0